MFAAEGVEVGVEAERGGVRAGSDFGHTAGAADLVGEVVEDVGLVVAAGGALTVEVNVFAEGGVGGAAGGIGFVENFAAGSVPVDLAVGFLDAVAVTVVGVVHAAAGLHFGFGVPGVGGGDIGSLVAGGIEAETGCGDLIVRVHRDIQRRSGPGSNGGGEIGPLVVGESLSPAVGAASRVGLRGNDAIDLIVGEGLRARGVAVVGHAVDVPVVRAQVEIIF